MSDMIGKKILTMHDRPTIGWHEQAYRSRKWGVLGTVSVEHFDHFEVKHDDGTIGFYESHELLKLEPIPYPDVETENHRLRTRLLRSLVCKWSREERIAFLLLKGVSLDQCQLNQVHQIIDLLFPE